MITQSVKLSQITQESNSGASDPFALEDWSDEDLMRIDNPKGAAAEIESIVDRDLQLRYVNLTDQMHAWNSIRASIEHAVAHKAAIIETGIANSAAVNKYNKAGDFSNRIEFGAVTSIDLNSIPKEYHEWLYKQKAKADHSMEMSRKVESERHEIATKLFSLQRSQKAKASAAAKKAAQNT